MKDKLKAISSELKKASKTHAGQAAKIDKLIKPKLSKLNKVNRMKKTKLSERKVARKKKAIQRKSKMIDNALNEYSSGKRGARAVKDVNRKLRAIYKKQAKIKKK